MRIDKVTEKKGSVGVVFSRPNSEGQLDQFSMNCHDKPAGSFSKAMQALVKDVVEICEFDDRFLNELFVTGVSFSYKGEESTMGAVITATKNVETAHGVLLLNTPYLPSEAKEGEPVLSIPAVKRLESLQAEAEKYVEGERMQMEMKLESQEETQEKGKKQDQQKEEALDKLVKKAVDVIKQTGRASTSMIQRQLRIGYTRAAKVMDLLEEGGIVGPPTAKGEPRAILVDLGQKKEEKPKSKGKKSKAA